MTNKLATRTFIFVNCPFVIAARSHKYGRQANAAGYEDDDYDDGDSAGASGGYAAYTYGESDDSEEGDSDYEEDSDEDDDDEAEEEEEEDKDDEKAGKEDEKIKPSEWKTDNWTTGNINKESKRKTTVNHSHLQRIIQKGE